MPQELTKARFEHLIDHHFVVLLADNLETTLELVEVSGLRSHNNPQMNVPSRVEPFSLLLRGSVDMPLVQATYFLQHADFPDAFPLFLVPVQANAESRFYEAIFN